MFQIKKVINNNVLLVQDTKFQEYILMGKGIGFNFKVDETIEKDQFEKKFILSDNSATDYLLNNLAQMSNEMFLLMEEIMHLIQKELDVEYTQQVFLSLFDHIDNTIKMNKLGVALPSILETNELEIYHKERSIAQQIVNLINKTFAITLEENEVDSLTIHLTNIIYDMPFRYLTDNTHLIIKQITDIIRYNLNGNIDYDDYNYIRLILHLKYFVLRNSRVKKVNSDKVNDLYHDLKNKHLIESQLTDKIIYFLEENYNWNVNDDEKTYLLIHIIKIFN